MEDSSKERLVKYYELIMGGQSEQQKKTLDYVYGRMTENALKEAEETLSKKDPNYAQMVKRISAYAVKIQELTAPKEQKEAAERLFKAYEGFDFEKFQREEINGNIFEFEKGFPIDQFREQLFEIGNHEKDNTYMVDLDSEGKLEVY